MPRLPQPGQDAGRWGTILNDYLSQVHNVDGTLKNDVVGADQLKDGAVTSTAIADNTLPQSKIINLTTDLSSKATTTDLVGKLDTAAVDSTVANHIDDTNSQVRAALSSTYVTQDRIRRQVSLCAPISGIIPSVEHAFPLLLDAPPTFTSSASHGVTSGVERPVMDVASWHGPVAVENIVNGTVTVWKASAGQGGLATAPSQICWEFVTDSPRFALHGAFGIYPVTIIVDGRLASSLPFSGPGNEFACINWSEVRKLRHYRIFGKSIQLKGIVVGPADTVYPFPVEVRPTLGWMGDSYSLGGPVATSHWSAIPDYVAAILGVNLAKSGEGGSGYAIGTSGGTNTFFARLAAFESLSVSAMFWAGGINDAPAGLQASAEACFAGFAASHPGIPQFALGPWSPSSAWEASNASKFTQLEAACAAHDVTFIDNRGWITGTGMVSAPVGDGNADLMISSDGTHPSSAGAEYLGVRLAYALASAIQGVW